MTLSSWTAEMAAVCIYLGVTIHSAAPELAAGGASSGVFQAVVCACSQRQRAVRGGGACSVLQRLHKDCARHGYRPAEWVLHRVRRIHAQRQVQAGGADLH